MRLRQPLGGGRIGGDAGVGERGDPMSGELAADGRQLRRLIADARPQPGVAAPEAAGGPASGVTLELGPAAVAEALERAAVEHPERAGLMLNAQRVGRGQRIELCAGQLAGHGLVVAEGAHPGAWRPLRQRAGDPRPDVGRTGGAGEVQRLRPRGQREEVDVVVDQAGDQRAATAIEVITGMRQPGPDLGDAAGLDPQVLPSAAFDLDIADEERGHAAATRPSAEAAPAAARAMATSTSTPPPASSACSAPTAAASPVTGSESASPRKRGSPSAVQPTRPPAAAASSPNATRLARSPVQP